MFELDVIESRRKRGELERREHDLDGGGVCGFEDEFELEYILEFESESVVVRDDEVSAKLLCVHRCH